MEISLLGYVSQSCTAALPGTKDFSHEPDREMLGVATVTERTPLMEMKIDKLVMNVGQSAFSQGSNGLELIKKAPGVTRRRLRHGCRPRHQNHPAATRRRVCPRLPLALRNQLQKLAGQGGE